MAHYYGITFRVGREMEDRVKRYDHNDLTFYLGKFGYRTFKLPAFIQPKKSK
jgi:hypothetical protein